MAYDPNRATELVAPSHTGYSTHMGSMNTARSAALIRDVVVSMYGDSPCVRA